MWTSRLRLSLSSHPEQKFSSENVLSGYGFGLNTDAKEVVRLGCVFFFHSPPTRAHGLPHRRPTHILLSLTHTNYHLSHVTHFYVLYELNNAVPFNAIL